MKGLLQKYYRLLQTIVTTLMGLLIVPVTLQIISRYIGIIPRYIWTEEAARFCFMWRGRAVTTRSQSRPGRFRLR